MSNKHEEFRKEFKGVMESDNAIQVLEAVEQWIIKRESKFKVSNEDIDKMLPFDTDTANPLMEWFNRNQELRREGAKQLMQKHFK